MPNAGKNAASETPPCGRPLWDEPIDPDKPLGPHLTLVLPPDSDEPEFVDEWGRPFVPAPQRAETLCRMAAEWLEQERLDALPTMADKECLDCHIAREEGSDASASAPRAPKTGGAACAAPAGIPQNRENKA